jgi:hypothetical protein
MLDSDAELVFVMPRLEFLDSQRKGADQRSPPFKSLTLIGTIQNAIIVFFSTSIR